jgi:hypothetical protein
MRGKILIALILLSSIISGCSNKPSSEAVEISEVIDINRLKKVDASSPGDIYKRSPEYICFQNADSVEFYFRNIRKIIIKNDKIYILDSAEDHLLIFDINGFPLSRLSNLGRGPNEYLQITDFDVDGRGNIWIVDGQRNVVCKYSSDFDPLAFFPFSYEIDKIHCLANDNLLLQISSWDESEYAGTKLAVADSSFNILHKLLKYPDNKDDNFMFRSEFSFVGTSTFYSDPIEDYLYEISEDGKLLNTYYFDFGNDRVPDKYREDIELHYKEIKEMRFIFRSYRVSQKFITCGINHKKWYSAIIDRSNSTISYLDSEETGYDLVGQCQLGSIWQLSKPAAKGEIPEEVKGWLWDDLDVLAIYPDR